MESSKAKHLDQFVYKVSVDKKHYLSKESVCALSEEPLKKKKVGYHHAQEAPGNLFIKESKETLKSCFMGDHLVAENVAWFYDLNLAWPALFICFPHTPHLNTF